MEEVFNNAYSVEKTDTQECKYISNINEEQLFNNLKNMFLTKTDNLDDEFINRYIDIFRVNKLAGLYMSGSFALNFVMGKTEFNDVDIFINDNDNIEFESLVELFNDFGFLKAEPYEDDVFDYIPYILDDLKFKLIIVKYRSIEKFIVNKFDLSLNKILINFNKIKFLTDIERLKNKEFTVDTVIKEFRLETRDRIQKYKNLGYTLLLC